MNGEMKELFNAIIEEMGKAEERTNKRFDKIDKTLETMQHEINVAYQ